MGQRADHILIENSQQAIHYNHWRANCITSEAVFEILVTDKVQMSNSFIDDVKKIIALKEKK